MVVWLISDAVSRTERSHFMRPYTLAVSKLTIRYFSGTTVYDITDWVDSHPGGSVIMRAAGGALEPYWSVFSFHTKPDIAGMLDEMKIGEVSSPFWPACLTGTV